MKLIKYTLLFFITFFSISIYAQESNNNEVYVEDQAGSEEWKKNDSGYRELDKQFRELMDNFLKFYNDMRKRGFSTDPGFSKEKLGVFISEAEEFKNNRKNNVLRQVTSLNNQLNNLAKVTSRSAQDRVAYFLNSLPSIEEDITSAKSLITDIEKDESKKEVSLDFSNTSSSSSETNNSTSTTDSNNSNDNSQSNTTTESSMSAADLHYKNALERQRIYQEGMQNMTNQLVDLGVSIANDIQQARVRNVATKNKYISEYLEKIIPLDKECADLYANNKYDAFLIKEKELRKYEDYVIDHLNWLIDKEGDSNYKNFKKEVTRNQKSRLKLILEHNTNELLNNPKQLKNTELLGKFYKTYINEIKDFIGGLATESGGYNLKGEYNYYRKWVDFIDEEREVRTQKILELNKTENILTPIHEACLYVYSNYYDSYYDNKVADVFLKANKSEKKVILYYAIVANNIINYKVGSLIEKDERHLRLLLGDGSEKIYYYEVETSTSKKLRPLYKYLDDRYSGYKRSKANELVKGWIKRDEKLTGKKAKKIFEEFSKENESVTSAEQSINSFRNEIISLKEKREYDKALLLVNKARKEFPDNYDLLANETAIYFEKGNNTKVLELLKEGVILKPNKPDLYYNIGALEAEQGNFDEAMNYYKETIKIDSNYLSAYVNISALILNKEHVLIEEMNSLGKTEKDNLRYDELKGKRLEIHKEAIPYLEKAYQLDTTNEAVKNTLLNIKKLIE